MLLREKEKETMASMQVQMNSILKENSDSYKQLLHLVKYIKNKIKLIWQVHQVQPISCWQGMHDLWKIDVYFKSANSNYFISLYAYKCMWESLYIPFERPPSLAVKLESYPMYKIYIKKRNILVNARKYSICMFHVYICGGWGR